MNKIGYFAHVQHITANKILEKNMICTFVHTLACNWLTMKLMAKLGLSYVIHTYFSVVDNCNNFIVKH